eukprot:maker-scaffold783_size97670-snap-gene-0.20 protein:Tk08992 transcript:maker-scaffold783_size97670-snap-gene-0.20-mRNA-1 annotation:"hypothetical protein HMPREF1544_09400"
MSGAIPSPVRRRPSQITIGFMSFRANVVSDETSCEGLKSAMLDSEAKSEGGSGHGAASASSRKTLSCFLCGGTHIYPGPRFENHLMNEHGAVFDLEFIIQLSLFKQEHGRLPHVEGEPAASNGHWENGNAPTPKSADTQDGFAQTETKPLCSDCQGPVDDPAKSNGSSLRRSKRAPQSKSRSRSRTVPFGFGDEATLDELASLGLDETEEEEEADDEDLSRDEYIGLDPHHYLASQGSIEENGASHLDRAEPALNCWQCPSCPALYRQQSSFKQHASADHALSLVEVLAVEPIQMTLAEFTRRKVSRSQRPVGNVVATTSKTFPLDKSKRKPIGKEWAPNSFSSTFTCFFCNEQFRKDYKLKLHLMLNHKSENAEDMIKAKEELTKSKLDGCVHKCALCGSKYNSVANFTRHIKDVHNMSRAQYREDYGSSEVVSRMFKCELCEKEVKHTRNIIGAHMKMVHLISWREYQEILVKIRQGESVGDLPAPELFDCVICGVSVKYKREHLNKKHQITEDVYDELILKKNRGEDISDSLPARELVRCLICDRECLDFKKHIERSHQITEEMYEEIITSRGLEDQRRSISQFEESLVTNGKAKFSSKSSPGKSNKRSCSDSFGTSSVRSESPGTLQVAGANPLSTDLQCYFGCDEVFKKDYQLYLHLKLKHRSETTDEIARAYEAADEEIALTKRSGSVFQCSLCPKQFNDNGAFYSHIQSKHDMQWRDYKEQYGRCEVESSPFECKICSRVIKYDRNTIHTHLKNVHGINWTLYLDRLRKMRRGEQPDALPQIEMIECRVCNVQVKYLKDHLRNAHKITEQEYESLFEGEHDLFGSTTQAMELGPSHVESGTSKVKDPITPQMVITDGVNLLSSQPVAIPKPPKSDIQNKTNKACSSCEITFESRRGFIEHCTTVHSMKFKTKSGITISAPTLQHPMKRKLNSEPIVDLPKRIRRGTDTSGCGQSMGESNISSGSTDRHGGSSATQYTPNGVSKWNQCVYQCCFCGKSTQSRSSMTSHIHNSHGIPIKEYKEKNYPDIEVETRWFQCRLCSARTKFVKDCIAPHLKMSHNMEIEHYEKNCMQPEDWPTTSGTLVSKSEPKLVASPPAQSVAKPSCSTPLLVGKLSNSSVNLSKEDKWNRCRFKCVLCKWTNVDSRQMRAHIATKHHMNYETYVQANGTAEVVTVKFQCELCNSEMKHCRQNIYAHMKDVHKITLDEYEDRVGGYDSSTAQEVPFMTHGDDITSEPSNEQPIIVHSEALVDNGNQPSRWNKCRFQCAICQKLSSEKRHIRDHIVKAHGVAMPDYEATYGDCEVHTEYFFCAVCHAEVKHNLKNISLHLQNVHGLSPQDYEDKYGRVPDEPAIPLQPAANSDEQLSFGSHFLLEENGDDSNDLSNGAAGPPKAKRVRPSAKIPGGLPCDYCGKIFSNRSNCNRHMILSCESRKGGSNEDSNSDVKPSHDDTDESQEAESNEAEQAPLEKPRQPLKCPYPDCEVTHVRSALLKRHLFDAHNIQNVSVQLPELENDQISAEALSFIQVKSEPSDNEEDRKVPPLRVKLHNGVTSPESTPGSKPPLKEVQPCQFCSYKNSNRYILGRHQRACEKRQQNSLLENGAKKVAPINEPDASRVSSNGHASVIESVDEDSDVENLVINEDPDLQVASAEKGGNPDESQLPTVQEPLPLPEDKSKLEHPAVTEETSPTEEQTSPSEIEAPSSSSLVSSSAPSPTPSSPAPGKAETGTESDLVVVSDLPNN